MDRQKCKYVIEVDTSTRMLAANSNYILELVLPGKTSKLDTQRGQNTSGRISAIWNVGDRKIHCQLVLLRD